MPYVFQIGDQRSGPATYFETLLRRQRYGRLSYLLCIRHSFHYHYATSRIGRPRDTLPKASTNTREVRTYCLSSFKMLSRQHETDPACLVSALGLKYRSPVRCTAFKTSAYSAMKGVLMHSCWPRHRCHRERFEGDIRLTAGSAVRSCSTAPPRIWVASAVVYEKGCT
jgi:hypothetical protein